MHLFNFCQSTITVHDMFRFQPESKLITHNAASIYWYNKQIKKAKNNSFQDKLLESSKNIESNMPVLLRLLLAHSPTTNQKNLPAKMGSKKKDSL